MVNPTKFNFQFTYNLTQIIITIIRYLLDSYQPT